MAKYPESHAEHMTFAEFSDFAAGNPAGIVLLEGRRAIPADYAALATNTAALLARQFPSLRFRSGNAEGRMLVACKSNFLSKSARRNGATPGTRFCGRSRTGFLTGRLTEFLQAGNRGLVKPFGLRHDAAPVNPGGRPAP